MKLTVTILAITLGISSGLAHKKPLARVTKEQATKTVHKQFKGAVIASSELEKEGGKLIWSFDLKDGGATREVWVDARTGRVIKSAIESPVKEAEERATDKAERIALKKIPGNVVKSTVKTKRGKSICSVEILTRSGRTVEVDVDQKTNRVVRVQTQDQPKKH